MKPPANRAVFLDRDGVVCREKSYITSPEQLELYPFARPAVLRLQKAGWQVHIVSNQSAIAQGLMDEADLALIHRCLLQEIPVDKIYYCPHHPEGTASLPYAMQCSCRKPEPGMILRAARENQVDLSCSYMVGDRVSDIQAGYNAGLITVLVRTGYGEETEKQIKADWVFDDLGAFVDYLTATSA